MLYLRRVLLFLFWKVLLFSSISPLFAIFLGVIWKFTPRNIARGEIGEKNQGEVRGFWGRRWGRRFEAVDMSGQKLARYWNQSWESVVWKEKLIGAGVNWTGQGGQAWGFKISPALQNQLCWWQELKEATNKSGEKSICFWSADENWICWLSSLDQTSKIMTMESFLSAFALDPISNMLTNSFSIEAQLASNRHNTTKYLKYI